MPTPEEIKKIAREFAEETSNGDALDPHIDFATEYASEVLQWLSKTHCIVPKSQLKELYDYYKRHDQDFNNKGLYYAMFIARGSIGAMYDIFGSSLFNEEK